MSKFIIKKTMLIGLPIILLVLIMIFWFFGFIYANDFSVQSKEFPTNIQRVLVIFPHADDEALTSGGLISQLIKMQKNVTWIVLTEGERGNEGANFDESLKAIRIKEAQDASAIYGIKNLVQKQYHDNGMTDHKDILKEDLRKTISETKPDLIITYDLAGLYGHPDHIVVSEVVTELLDEEYSEIKLWYASYPKRLLDAVPLPEHMAKDSKYKERRVYPTRRAWVGIDGVIKKIKAVYTYKSQRFSYIKSLPVKQIPLWFYISLTPFEYYNEVR